MHFEIDRRDIRTTRWVTTTPPTSLVEGQVLLKLERAALTSNNVSYALSGDMLDYWGFFPTEQPWGRLPVMGFGIIEASAHPEVKVGGRYFGFFPLADHHVVDARPNAGVSETTLRGAPSMPLRTETSMLPRSLPKMMPCSCFAGSSLRRTCLKTSSANTATSERHKSSSSARLARPRLHSPTA